MTTNEINTVIKDCPENADISFSSYRVKNFNNNLFKPSQLTKRDYEELNIDLESIYFIPSIKDYLLKFHKNLIARNINIEWSLPKLLNDYSDLRISNKILGILDIPKIDFIDPEELKVIFLDFDGVLTDNYLFSDKYGNEVIRTSKYDNYAIIRLQKNLRF